MLPDHQNSSQPQEKLFIFDAVIPGLMLDDEEIPRSAIKLYALVRNLSNKYGYCFTTNKRLGEALNLQIRQLNNLLSVLENKGYILRRENGDTFNPQRHIYITDPRQKKINTPMHSECTPPCTGNAYIKKSNSNKEKNTPIVPKGDPPPSSKKRKTIREEKKEIADRVYISASQHENLLKRANNDETLVASWYDRLSTWKIGKEIFNGNGDYQAIIKWVISAVKDDVSAKGGSKESIISRDREIANQVKRQLPKSYAIGKINNGHNYIEFVISPTNIVQIKFGDGSFKDQIVNILKKMNLLSTDFKYAT